MLTLLALAGMILVCFSPALILLPDFLNKDNR